eukprot:snap_masked-scaffold_31-processed-gene-1.44-mRNA-1 protein AED:1.00 eAED:1.00 QI:0/0/0/0/1/1/6/0/949
MSANSSSPSFDLSQLNLLRKAFDEADTDGENGLDMNEFVDAFGQILGKNLSKQQLINLYMKIDANSDGTVDWAEFIEYMLLQNKGAELMREAELGTALIKICMFFVCFNPIDGNFAGKCENKEPFAECNKEDAHKKRVVSSIYCESLRVFITLGQDSRIKLWQKERGLGSFHLKVIRTLQVPPAITFNATEPAEPKTDIIKKQKSTTLSANVRRLVLDDYEGATAWPQDVIYMSASNCFAICTSNRSLNFYEARQMKLVGRIRPLWNSPVALNYFHFEEENLENLFLCDMKGFLLFWKLEALKWEFPDNTHHSCRHLKPKGVKFFSRIKISEQALTAVQYIQDLQTVVVSCEDSTVTIVDLERLRVRRVFKKHTKAVTCFQYFITRKCMISAGRDKTIKLWNPYTLVLLGEVTSDYIESSTIQLELIEKQFQYIIILTSLSFIRFFDSFSLELKHVLNLPASFYIAALDNSFFSSFLYYPEKQFIIAFNPKPHAYYIKKLQKSDPTTTHEGDGIQRETIALYNQEFKQVVTLLGQEVKIWDISTNCLLFKFLHPEQVAFLNACFDTSWRRLVTSNVNGVIEVWNFNNGALLAGFQLDNNSTVNREITCLQYASIVLGNKQMDYVLASGWSNEVVVFEDEKRTVGLPMHSMPKKKKRELERCHIQNIIRMIFVPPGFICTGCSKGKVILWGLESGYIKHILHEPPKDSNQGKKGISLLHYIVIGEKGFILIGDFSGGVLMVSKDLTEKIMVNCVFDNAVVIGTSTETYCLLGDQIGSVSLLIFEEDSKKVEKSYTVKIHSKQIISLILIESKEGFENKVLSSSFDGKVKLSVIDKEKNLHILGFFGSIEHWDLSALNLFECKEYTPSEPNTPRLSQKSIHKKKEKSDETDEYMSIRQNLKNSFKVSTLAEVRGQDETLSLPSLLVNVKQQKIQSRYNSFKARRLPVKTTQ